MLDTRPPVYFLATATEAGEEKGNEDGVSQIKRDEAPYEFSLDPDTKAAEKKLRRVVAKQVSSKFSPKVGIFACQRAYKSILQLGPVELLRLSQPLRIKYSTCTWKERANIAENHSWFRLAWFQPTCRSVQVFSS